MEVRLIKLVNCFRGLCLGLLLVGFEGEGEMVSTM